MSNGFVNLGSDLGMRTFKKNPNFLHNLIYRPVSLDRLCLRLGTFFMTYKEQLLDDRWKVRRAEIIDRNLGFCSVCGTSKNIQVHHKKYIAGLMAWEYPDYLLTTLCSDCHKLEHNLVPDRNPTKSIKDCISEFIESITKNVRRGQKIN